MTSATTTSAPPPGTNAIEARALTKHFGDIVAVDALDLELAPGRIYGLLGPNGSGKTTLIRCLVGLARPTSGEAKVLGVKMPDRENLAHIGYMTQADGIYIELSVWENLRFFAALSGTGDKAAMDEILDVVELTSRKNTPALESLGRHAPPAVAGVRAGSSAVGALPRRADRGHRSRAASPVLDILPEARRGRHHARRQQPRDGRGRSLRRAAADAPREAARTRHRAPRSAHVPAQRTWKRPSCAWVGTEPEV